VLLLKYVYTVGTKFFYSIMVDFALYIGNMLHNRLSWAETYTYTVHYLTAKSQRKKNTPKKLIAIQIRL
jgi:hypothetical protein